MKRPIVNIDRAWTRIVWTVRRLVGKPIVAHDREHPRTRSSQRAR